MSLRAWSSARWTVPLPPGHRFPIAKYSLIRDAVVASGTLSPGAIAEPERVSIEALDLVHDPSYVTSILEGSLDSMAARRLGFPWSPELRERSLRTVQGTLEAAHDALAQGAGMNLAGGTHHAFADHGEGFCVFNDVAVATRFLQRAGAVRRVAIIDLDVHQGNGTARIFENDPDVFTFSMHGDNNYPFHKESSRLDVGLPDDCDDASYLERLGSNLDAVLDAADPELVCYLGGADPFMGDRFGRLKLSIEGLRRRDRMVFDACQRRGLPIVLTLAGGYAADLNDIATIHLNTVRELVARYA